MAMFASTSGTPYVAMAPVYYNGSSEPRLPLFQDIALTLIYVELDFVRVSLTNSLILASFTIVIA